MTSAIKTSSSATVGKIIITEKKGKSMQAKHLVCILLASSFLGIETFAKSRTVCRGLNQASIQFLEKESLRLQYAKGFFRLLWIDYFNLLPTDPNVRRIAGQEGMPIVELVSRKSSFNDLIVMNGTLDPTSTAEVQHEKGEFAVRYSYFRQFVAALTELVMGYSKDEFLGFMHEAAKLREKDRLETINLVFVFRNKELVQKKNWDELMNISVIPGLSGFVPVKTSESCCVIL